MKQSTVIYSVKRVEGLEGAYAVPSMFTECESCTLVYTDDAKIKKAYEAKGIEVKELSKPKPKPKAKKD